MKSFKPQSGPRTFNIREPLFCYEATYEVSENIENFIESLYIQEKDVSQFNFM